MSAATLLAPLVAGVLAAQVSAPLTRQQEAVARFSAACFDGELRLSAGDGEIAVGDLPTALRAHYRNHFGGRYFRLGGRRPSYLVMLTTERPGDRFSSVCGLAVPAMRLSTLFDAAIRALGGPTRMATPQNSDSVAYDDRENGYVVSGVAVGGHALLEVAQYRETSADSKPETN